MDRDGRWTKEDIPKLREIKKDPKQVEKLKQEKKWCDPNQYELLLKCSEKNDVSEWNNWRAKNQIKEGVWLQNTNLCNLFCTIESTDESQHSFIQLLRANLENSNFSESNLETAHLSNAKLIGAILENVNLRESTLTKAILIDADLNNANLEWSKSYTVDFTNAVIRGTNFNNSELYMKPRESTDFSGVKYNAKDQFLWWRFWFLIWFIACKILHIKKYPKPDKNHYKQTTFIGVDTTNVDWSKNPQLKRDIHNQQYLHDYKSKLGYNLLKRFIAFLWWVTSDYGDGIWRWVIWSLAIAVFFAGLFSGWFTYENGVWEQPKLHYQTHDLLYEKETGQPNPDIEEPNFSESLYYSVVTFTTLGFGDVVPVNASGRWAVMFEVILGYIMLGGLISLFANKFVRRE